MRSLFCYLWINRETPRFLSKRFFMVWIKRLLNLSGLIKICFRRLIYRFKGVEIGTLSVIDRIELDGNAQLLSVGNASVISRDVYIALHAPVNIGSNVVISRDVKILTASHFTNDSQWKSFSKSIEIADYSWVATGAIVLPGVKIGRGAVVGAGAVVSKDVKDFEVVAGNPASSIGLRNTHLNYSPVNLCSAYEAWVGKLPNASSKVGI